MAYLSIIQCPLCVPLFNYGILMAYSVHTHVAICISLPFAVLVVKINGAALNASNYQYQLAEQGTPAPDLQIVDILLEDQNMVRAWGSNLTAITWAHAVNNQQLLDEALSGEIAHYTPLQV